MANQIRFKRASGSDPSASDLAIGEPGLRTDTAELFFKKDDGTIAKVSGGGGGPDFKYLELRNAANNGAASYPGNDFTLVEAGTTTAVSPAAAATLLVSVSGVIQKPNSGTSTSGITGFIVDGSRFKTATNLPAAPDFIIYQESGGIGEPSDNTVTSAKIVDGAILNADINASAAIDLSKLNNGTLPNGIAVTQNNIAAGSLVTGAIAAGTGFQISNNNVSNSAAIAGSKISPTFTSDITVSNNAPAIFFTDGNENPDYALQANQGVFTITDTTNGANRLEVYSDRIEAEVNLDAKAGLDVTGLLTADKATFTDDGSASPIVHIKADDSAPFGLIIGNDSYSNDAVTGLKWYVANNGNCFHEIAGASDFVEYTFKSSNQSTGHTLLKATTLRAIELYFQNVKRFETVNGGVSVTGNITVSGTVDGRDLATDGSKLDGIESGATADQTKSDIDALGIAAATATEATNVTALANNSTNTSYRVPFLSAATGTSRLQSDNADGMSYNPSTGTLTATAFNGNGASLTSVNAATLDSLDSTQFLRSDASDTMSGTLTLAESSSNQKLILSGTNDPYIRFQEGTTNKAYIQWHSDGYINLVNSESSESLRIQSGSSGLKFVEGGSVRNVYHTGNLSVGDNGLTENNFTDALKSKLDGIATGATVGLPTSGGTLTGTLNARAIVPTANNTYDLGTSSNRWRNIYTNDLNLSNEGGVNDVDSTWGSFTIQEGAEDLFLINKRNGKKYKFNLTEVS